MHPEIREMTNLQLHATQRHVDDGDDYGHVELPPELEALEAPYRGTTLEWQNGALVRVPVEGRE